MKCPECGLNNQVKYGLTCNCGYRFVFNPKEDGIADGKFASIIRNAGKNDTRYFLKDQLFTSYCNKLKIPVKGFRITAFVLMLISLILLFNGMFPFSIFLGIIMLIFFGLSFAPNPKKEDFEKHFKKWTGSKGQIEKLILEPGLKTPPPNWDDKDIYDYGVEKILVVQHDILVDFFVLNDFHSANRSLVISDSGYPQYLIPQAVKLLNENPDLPVFYLHDADVKGLKKASEYRRKGLLGTEIKNFTDLGLFPEDVKKIKSINSSIDKKNIAATAITLLPVLYLSEITGFALEKNSTLAGVLNNSSGFSSDYSFG